MSRAAAEGAFRDEVVASVWGGGHSDEEVQCLIAGAGAAVVPRVTAVNLLDRLPVIGETPLKDEGAGGGVSVSGSGDVVDEQPARNAARTRRIEEGRFIVPPGTFAFRRRVEAAAGLGCFIPRRPP